MKLDLFHTTIGHPYLQRHLLAIQAPTLEAAIHAGKEFLQIKTHTDGSSIRQVEEDTPDTPEVARTASTPLDTLMSAIAKLTEEVQTLKVEQSRRPAPQTGRKVVRCYGCNKEGHVKRFCPAKSWSEKSADYMPQTGNEDGPQQ